MSERTRPSEELFRLVSDKLAEVDAKLAEGNARFEAARIAAAEESDLLRERSRLQRAAQELQGYAQVTAYAGPQFFSAGYASAHTDTRSVGAGKQSTPVSSMTHAERIDAVLSSADRHLSAQEITDEINQRFPSPTPVSRKLVQTVLADKGPACGWKRRVHLDGPTRYYKREEESATDEAART